MYSKGPELGGEMRLQVRLGTDRKAMKCRPRRLGPMEGLLPKPQALFLGTVGGGSKS